MRKLYCCTLLAFLAFLAFTGAGIAQDALPVPRYVPPEIQGNDASAFTRDMAIIETNCSTWQEVRSLWKQLTEKGALISVIATEKRWLGWVPQAASSAVREARLSTATGFVGVTSVSYSGAEFRANHKGLQLQSTIETEEAILEYLDYAKHTRTPAELQRIEERAQELEMLAPHIEQPPCVSGNLIPLEVPAQPQQKGPSILGGPNPVIARRSTPQGLIVHTSVFPESQSGTGSWNWDNTVYTRYRSLHVDAMNYWTAQAAKYGKSATLIWRLYGPTHWAVQVSGEPTVIGEHSFIPTIVNNIYPPSFWDLLFGRIPSWNGSNGLDRGDAWGWYYNNKMRDDFSADQAIMAFIAWKGTPGEGIWPHARSVYWGNGDHEGVYYAMDVRYWQSGLDPYAMPSRNVCAHEIGHLWGSPDEYRTDNCTWEYRGAQNINCQTTRSASSYGRPGYNLVGFDAMMVGNYLSGSSSVMPVHMGLLTAAQRTPLRCFTTQPANIPVTLHICDNSTHALSTRVLTGPTCVPMEWDFCHKTEVPLTRSISGTTWYFDYFEVKRLSGATVNIDWQVNNLSSWAFTSTRANPVTDIKAVYTNTPPDIFTANTSLSAWLAPSSSSATPGPAISLRWRNKYDMQKAETKIEWERGSGNWVEVTPVLGPFSTPVNQYTGVLITTLPQAGGGTIPVALNTQYRFRIVGYFNTNRGTPSSIADIRTRPSTPADTAYCHDTYEPNSSGSPKTLPSSGPGMTPVLFKAACPLTPIAGEFSWFIPKNDYYRITAINLSSATGGERLTLVLRVSAGSNFKPKFRAKRAGETTYINSISAGPDSYLLNLTNDGEYQISVEPEISSYIGYRLVEPSTGDFGYGEYTLAVDRTLNKPPSVAFCPACVRINLLAPFPGLLLSKAPGDLFDKGVDKNTPGSFDVFFDAPPGFAFDGWDAPKPDVLEDPKANPTKFKYGPNTPAGEYDLSARLKRVAAGSKELVVIFPEGPDGPFQSRTLHAPGSVVPLTAPPNANYLFVGWSHDTVSTSNPMNVTMWRDKKLIATWKENPCQPAQMTAWKQQILFTNAKQGTVTLEFGMDPGAGDGLEAGQVDLPPIPPPGPFDIRFVNISGSQGSTTDLRALQQSFTYLMRVQTGTSGLAPVQMTWTAPPATPACTYALYVQGEPAPIDMRTTTSYTFTAEGIYNCRIEVKLPSCPPRPNAPEVVIVPTRTDPAHFPCVEFGVQFRDRKNDMFYPLYNPYQFHLYEKNEAGEWGPIRISEIVQLPLMTLFRICTDESNPNPRPGRQIVLVNDDPDPDRQKDTITVNIPVPNPTGTGTPVRFVQKHSGDWELVSIPLDVKNTSTEVLYADPLTRLYGFDAPTGTYIAAPSMRFGDGYWLKTSDASTTYYGLEKLIMNWDTLRGIGLPYGYGWNLIGAVSKPLAVAAIQQTPAGGLKAIFGYNPVSGYVVPTTCNPGEGFWVRIDAGTKLKFQAPGVAGPPTITAYAKSAANLNIVGSLRISTARGEEQLLQVTSNVLSAQDADNLQLPPPPLGSGLDVRTEADTRFIPYGLTGIDIRGEGEVTLAFEASVATRNGYQLVDEHGTVLADFSGSSSEPITIPVSGKTRVFFKTLVTGPAGAFALEQNWPNPFSPQAHEATTIACTFAKATHARLAVYDVMGREVRLLFDQDLPQGTKHARWDGRNEGGDLLSAGTYLLRLQTAEGTLTKSMTIMNAK